MPQSAQPPSFLTARRNRAGIWVPSLLLLIGLLVTIAVVFQAHRFVSQERQAQFDTQLNRMRQDIAVHVYRNVDVLRTYQAEISLHRFLSLDSLLRVAQILELKSRFAGIDSIGYLPAAAQNAVTGDDYHIRFLYRAESSLVSPRIPAAEVSLHQEAIRRARDTGDIAATGPVNAGPDPGSPDRFMVYLPLYYAGITPASTAERRRNFEGVVFLTLHPARMMAGLFDHHQYPDAHIRLHFEGYAEASQVNARVIDLYNNQNTQPISPNHMRTQVPLELAGTQWSLEVEMRDLNDRWLPWAVLIIGLLLTLLSVFITDTLRRARLLSLQRASQDRDLRREAEAALLLRERAIEASANAILIADARNPGYPVEYVNPAFERMTGYDAAEILGKSLRIMHAKDVNQKGLEELQDILRQQVEGQVVLRNYRKDGQLYWTRLHVAPVRDEAGVTTHFVAAKYDITETRRYQEKLEYQAYYDALTHLPNRHLLRRRLNDTIASIKPDDPPFWVAFLDLDNFKLVNDSLGHTLGDIVLQRIAQRLLESLQEGDIVARRGGDEFVFILF
ncbi:MAG: diguanylate cyclase, partial [Burkholderiaceae bacterium]